MAFDVAVDDALRRVIDIVGQRLGPWPVRGLEALGAAPEQDRGAAFVQVEGGVGGEAGLADPRLTGDQRHLAVPALGRSGDVAQLGALLAPADEADRRGGAEARRQRHRVLGLAGLPVQPVGHDRRVDPLQFELADLLERCGRR